MTLAFTWSVGVDGRVGVSGDLLMEAAGQPVSKGLEERSLGDRSPGLQQQYQPSQMVCRATGRAHSPGVEGGGRVAAILVTVGYILIFHG